MTYSRPGTSGVNALPSIQTPRSTGIIGSPGVAANPGGRFVDFTNPAQVGKNVEIDRAGAGRNEALISKFLQESIGPVKEIGTAIAKGNAQKELGQLLDSTPNLGEQYRKGTPDAQAQIRSLSWMAQDMFYTSQLESGVAQYQTELSSKAIADSRLTSAGDWDDNKSQVFAQLESEVREEAFRGIPTGMIGGSAGVLGKVQGTIKGELQKASQKATANNRAISYSKGLGTDVLNFTTARTALESTSADAEQLDSVDFKFNAKLQEGVDKVTNGGIANPQDYLTWTLTGTAQQIAELVAEDKYDEADDLLDTLERATERPVMTGPDKKIDLWDYKAPGKEKGTTQSVQGWINRWRTQLDKSRDLGEKPRLLKEYKALFLRMADPTDTGAREEFRIKVLSTLDAESLPVALELMTQFSNFGDKPSDAQLTTQTSIASVLNDPYRDRAAVQARIDADTQKGNLTPAQSLTLTQQNNGTQTDPIAAAASAAKTDVGSSDAVEAIWRDVVAADPEIDPAANPTAATEKREEFDGIIWGRTRETLQALREANPNLEMTPQLRNSTYLKEAEKQGKSILNNLGAKETPAFTTEVTSELDQVRQNILDGKQGIERYPQSLIDRVKADNQPVTIKNLRARLEKRMGGAVNTDDSPMFPNASEALNKLIDAAEAKLPEEERGGRGAWKRRNNRRTAQDVDWSEILPEMTPRDRQGRPINQGESGGQEKAEVVFDKGLTTVAGAEVPSEAKVENSENLPALARSNGVGLADPPLPQVAAETKVQPVPMRISQDKHPFFVAIGIAEGTRTVDGGYTLAYYGHRDSGDDHFNVGTVSGGRVMGGTPAQVDKRWMGMLTQTQISATPLLQQLGLEPGTQAWNRTMFNVLDLRVQAPKALDSFFLQLPQVAKQGWSIEALANARAKSFYNPAGVLEASGFGNNYSRLFADQRSRAGVWDYRRRT